MWDVSKSDSKNEKAVTQRRNDYVDQDVSYFDPTVGVAFISSNERPAKLESPIPKSGFKSISNVKEVQRANIDAAENISILDNVRPMEVDTTITRASIPGEKARKFVVLWKFSR